MNILKKSTLAVALAATAIGSATPAMARDHYRRGGDATGAAIAGGIIGIALGAIIASSGNDRHRDNRYDDRRVYRDGYYYDRDGYRYDRDGYRNDRDNRWNDYNRRGYREDGYYRGF